MPDSPASKAAKPFNFVGCMQDSVYNFYKNQHKLIRAGLISIGLCYNQKKVSCMRPMFEGNPLFADRNK